MNTETPHGKILLLRGLALSDAIKMEFLGVLRNQWWLTVLFLHIRINMYTRKSVIAEIDVNVLVSPYVCAHMRTKVRLLLDIAKLSL